MRMPLFNLPLNSSTTRPSTRAHLHLRASKKRKRLSSPHVEFASDVQVPASSAAPQQSSLSAASTNPLSLDPEEAHQYKVAGLDLDQELPSQFTSGFPHRGLPPSFPAASHADDAVQTDEDGTETEDGKSQRERRAPHLRLQHLGVLTTILHRCLLEGDIPRASRAWAMLLRAQHNGKSIDIKSSGYWGIGAELLISGSKQPAQGRRTSGGDESASSEGNQQDSDSETRSASGEAERNQSDRRWGTASGLERAKDYYERLILQYPYTRQYPDSVNALDFWPAMLSCEIYGIQFEQKEALRNLATAEEEESSADTVTNKLWLRRDQIRHATLAAAEKVAARMDELMTTPPYADSPVLQRLRGMMALYVGNLSVPELFEVEMEPETETDDNGEEGGREEDGKGRGRRGRERQGQGSDSDGDDDVLREARSSKHGRRRERRLLRRNRRAEHERGLTRRKEEMARAQKTFERVRKGQGLVVVDADVAGAGW